MDEPATCRCGSDDIEITNLSCGLRNNDVDVQLISVTCDTCGRGTQAPTEAEAVEMWNRHGRV